MDTMIPEGLRIHMNCVKPPMSLGGKSPAVKIGIMKERVKWMDLLELALKENET